MNAVHRTQLRMYICGENVPYNNVKSNNKRTPALHNQSGWHPVAQGRTVLTGLAEFCA